MYFCGFGGNFCGQSSIDDVNSKSTTVILAFANILTNGSIEVDDANYPRTIAQNWKNSGKKVLLSIGGQNVDWNVAYTTPQNTINFINSINDAIQKYDLDGIDLDIESYGVSPRSVANMIISLKSKIGTKLLVLTIENVGVYQGVSVPSPDTIGQAWNYYVSVIRLADSSIDLYQVMAYNNWYGSLPGGSVAYLK